MHNYETDPDKLASHKIWRNTIDFPDLSKIIYKAPPVVREFKPKTSFVHTQVANKARVNNEHLESILNKKVFTTRKH